MSYRNDYTDPSPSNYGKITVSYPTPNLSDLIVDEQIEIRPENYEPLPVNTPHPANNETGRDLRLVWQGPAKGNDAFKAVRRIYASSRLNENAYNAGISFDADSKAHPTFLRSYIMLREDFLNRNEESAPVRNEPLGAIVQVTVELPGSGYTDATIITADTGGATFRPILYNGTISGVHILTEGDDYTEDLLSTTGGLTIYDSGGGQGAVITARVQPQSAVLIKEEQQPLGDAQLSALFVAVTQIYQTLPGYEVTGIKSDNFGGVETSGATLVAPDTVPVDSVSDLRIVVVITEPGDSYGSTPTVTFSGGGGGSGAAGTAVIVGGQIAGVTMTSHGSGYTRPPGINFDGGTGGTFAQGYCRLTGAETQEVQQLSSTVARLTKTIRDIGVQVTAIKQVDPGAPGSRATVSTYLVLASSTIPSDTNTTVYERDLFPEDSNLLVESKTVYAIPEDVVERRSATRPMPAWLLAAYLDASFGWQYNDRRAFSADVVLIETTSYSTTMGTAEVDVLQESSWRLPFGFSGSGLLPASAGGRTYTFIDENGDSYPVILDPSTPTYEDYVSGWIGQEKIVGASSQIWRAGIYKNVVITCVFQ